MKPVQSLLNYEKIQELASRSNFRYGQEILKNGEIIPVKSNAFNFIAAVKSNNKNARTVELSSTSKGLRWKCTCTGRKDLFCNHCTAVALYLVNSLQKKQEN